MTFNQDDFPINYEQNAEEEVLRRILTDYSDWKELILHMEFEDIKSLKREYANMFVDLIIDTINFCRFYHCSRLPTELQRIHLFFSAFNFDDLQALGYILDPVTNTSDDFETEMLREILFLRELTLLAIPDKNLEENQELVVLSIFNQN